MPSLREDSPLKNLSIVNSILKSTVPKEEPKEPKSILKSSMHKDEPREYLTKVTTFDESMEITPQNSQSTPKNPMFQQSIDIPS